MMRIAAGIIAAVLTIAGATPMAATSCPVKIERGEACVAPTGEMRRDHMKMLLHQRDRTMRQGIARAALQPEELRRLPRQPRDRQRARQGRLLLELPCNTPR